MFGLLCSENLNDDNSNTNNNLNEHYHIIVASILIVMSCGFAIAFIDINYLR